MTIIEAGELLRNGKKICRKQYPSIYLECYGIGFDRINLCSNIMGVYRCHGSWEPSLENIFANDWEEYKR